MQQFAATNGHAGELTRQRDGRRIVRRVSTAGVGFGSVQESCQQPGVTTETNVGESAQLVVVLEGTCFEENTAGRFRLDLGDVALRAAGEQHRMFTEERACRRLTFDVLPACFEDWHDCPGDECFVPVRAPECMLAVSQLAQAVAGDGAPTSFALVGPGLAVLDRIRRLHGAVVSEPRSQLAERVKGRIQRGYGGALSLQGIAKDLGVHRSHLARVFQAVEGCTVGEFLRRVRILAATKAIAGGLEPLEHIAQTCGFHDQSHMARVMRSTAGTTPGRIRRHQREIGPRPAVRVHEAPGPG